MKSKYLLLTILLIAIFFRFMNLNWDQGQHIHPDERFLTMVGNDLKVPTTIIQYLDPVSSPMNPVNIRDDNNNQKYGFFVYGTFPIVINKLLAVQSGTDTYSLFTYQGRLLSTISDLIIVLIIFKICELWEEKYKLNSNIKYYASFFYAIAVLPIQLSHFFAVDTFLNLFMLLSFYFALRFYYKPSVVFVILSSISFGLAISSKITAVFILPLISLFIFLAIVKLKTYFVFNHFRYKKIINLFVLFIIFFGIAYFTIRLGFPYIFQDSNFLDPRPNSVFVQNLKLLKSWEGKDIFYPPGIQWISKPPVIFSLINLAFFGVGLPYFLFIIVGILYIFTKQKNIIFVSILIWLTAFFLYQSTQFAQAMRYFIFLYPFLAIIAGFGFFYFTDKWKLLFKSVALITILIWPLSFLSIYLHPLSRVSASEWIYNNVPDNNIILSEYWDDALPLNVSITNNKTFSSESLHIFDPDTSQKWQLMNNFLTSADYYILSSNRGWGSIMAVPWKYPMMSKYYTDLFAGKTNYKKIKEFTSYPSLNYLGIPFTIPDDWADESFTVYDHPKVIIFKNLLKTNSNFK